ncbi:unnamed protein product [Cylindrotheca closterium]|uniref:Uncharacterized protein n=1 Tax=Cylindrotheca closterium TaxID=2856 RepID=A0AAD2CRV9_9STRA|nr:unnamed protein product [Cylindrotheca closterium]
MCMKRFSLVTFLWLLATVTASQYCVDEEVAYLREQENNAPSPAPSISRECTTQTSNARGKYTSTVSPCTFEFHKAQEHQRELDLIRFHTSDLCSSENSFLTVQEYVEFFPDECVADFQRCYSLEHHRSVIWDFLCTKGWDIPEGTTHVSVDCQRDKELIIQATTHRREEMIRGEQHARVETYQSKLFNLASILGVCLVGVYAISNLIVKPLVASRLYTAVMAGSGDGSCNNNNNQDILPRTIQPRYQMLHAAGSVGGNSSTLDDSAVIYGGDHPSQIMIMGAEEDGEGSSELNESQLMEDFNSQMPDFDAVPITFAASHHGTTHRAHSDLTTDSAVLPMTRALSTTTEEELSADEHLEVSIQTAAASIISSARSTRRYSSNVPRMELELVPMASDPDDIPIVPATILYS